MADTPNLQMPLMSASQAQKHVTHNDALRVLDATVMLSIIDRDLTAPPGSPSEGDRYIPASVATGDWAGEEGNVAVYQNAAWAFYDPAEGWECWVEDEVLTLRFDGINWGRKEGAEQPFGSALKLRCVEEELTGLSGATAVSTVAFPNQCIILGVSLRVTTAIAGAVSFDAGDGITVGRFGATLNIAGGSTNQGTIGPAGNYASTTVTLTANGGNFTAGAVRIALIYLELTPPTS